jgi:hypothetical protein
VVRKVFSQRRWIWLRLAPENEVRSASALRLKLEQAGILLISHKENVASKYPKMSNKEEVMSSKPVESA